MESDKQHHDVCVTEQVIITAHQAFLTIEALTTIADTTVDNIKTFHAGTCKSPAPIDDEDPF